MVEHINLHIFKYNNPEDRDLYFSKVPIRLSDLKDAYTPSNKMGIWDHSKLVEQIFLGLNKTKDTLPNIDKTFDKDHLKSLNKSILKEIFHFSGDTREVNLKLFSDANTHIQYMPIGTSQFDHMFNNISSMIKSENLPKISKEILSTLLLNTISHLDYMHSFRFADTMTSNLFINSIIKETQFEIPGNIKNMIPRSTIDRIREQTIYRAHELSHNRKIPVVDNSFYKYFYDEILRPKCRLKNPYNEGFQKHRQTQIRTLRFPGQHRPPGLDR
ncbi:hypothetical protein [Stomatohabitans albus]|uniref:hypothetical protein n=1 Tax=Stomatohabitans albus TaxID=3110766 RepID=UPI00300C41EC